MFRFFTLTKRESFLTRKIGLHFLSKNIPDFFSLKNDSLFVCSPRVQFSVWSLATLVSVEGQLETQALGQLLIIWEKNV